MDFLQKENSRCRNRRFLSSSLVVFGTKCKRYFGFASPRKILRIRAGKGGNPLETTPIRKRETELNPGRGSARLRANRFAPLQTVDRPKPGKLRDQDGWQAGCARKRVLPSRFLIGLSRASDETRRKGLLNPSDPQLLRGRLAWRGRLARRPPRRRPSELAPLGLLGGPRFVAVVFCAVAARGAPA